MTVTTPPRPSAPDVIHDSGDPKALDALIEEARTGSDQPGDPEALIEEARQRTRTRRRRYAALALAAAAGLGLYFGLVNGGGTSAQPIVALASPPAAPVAAYPGYFELWFIRGWERDGCCGAFPTWRTAAQLGISPDEDIHTRREINGLDENRRATDLLERVLTSLVAGPTPADQELLDEGARDAGYPEGLMDKWGTGFPPDTQLLGVTLSNGIATIDISSSDEFGNTDPYVGPESGVDLLFSQLVFTATQFPFVDGVLFKLDGQPRTAQIRLEDEPDIYERVGRPVTRADYEGSRGEDAVSRQGPGT